MPKKVPGAAARYCGRPFTHEEIALIRRHIAAEPRPNRAQTLAQRLRQRRHPSIAHRGLRSPATRH